MSTDEFSPAASREIRQHWFAFLDAIEGDLAPLHDCCRRLTRNTWDAEDLLQETLLRGYAMVARGDFHGDNSKVANRRAYLFRLATNLWIDQVRHLRPTLALERGDSLPGDNPTTDPVATVEALDHLLTMASRQEFSALILKDVFGYTLVEIADMLETTPGTIKSALSRVRGKTFAEPASDREVPGHRAIAEAFAQALGNGDNEGVLALLSDHVRVHVANVGGGRGKSGEWTNKTLARDLTARVEEVDGALVILLLVAGALTCVVRLDCVDGEVVAFYDYSYARETLILVADVLGLPYGGRGIHQGADTLKGMIATTDLPWWT